MTNTQKHTPTPWHIHDHQDKRHHEYAIMADKGNEQLLEEHEDCHITDDQLIVRLRAIYNKRAILAKATGKEG